VASLSLLNLPLVHAEMAVQTEDEEQAPHVPLVTDGHPVQHSEPSSVHDVHEVLDANAKKPLLQATAPPLLPVLSPQVGLTGSPLLQLLEPNSFR